MKKKAEIPDFSGLPNLGNTCYMNSALQTIFHIPHIYHFLDSLQSYEEKSEIFKNLLDVFRSLQKNDEILISNLKLFTKSFLEKHKHFQENDQEDAQEFLKLLLEEIHDNYNYGDKNKKIKDPKFSTTKDFNLQMKEYCKLTEQKDKSIITKVFGGVLVTSFFCLSCKNEKKIFENFWDLSISFRQTSSTFDVFTKKNIYSLKELIENFQSTEKIKKICEKCEDYKEFYKKIEIVKIPKVMIIHLKRFYFKEDGLQKVNYQVKFPIKNFKLSNNNKKYNLIGIIHHFGSEMHFGHYLADCKNTSADKWTRYNDEKIDDFNIEIQEFDKKGLESAYMLIYERST
jgi:ubiquitin C-terminal hydrolase